MRPAYLLAAATLLLCGTVPAAAEFNPPKFLAQALASENRPPDDVKRDRDRKPADMVMFATIKPGKTVVELVPGSGYFTRIFSNVVGSDGQVYAFWPVELDARLTARNVPIPVDGTVDPAWANVTVVHKSLAELALPQQVDVVWTSQNYHDFHNSYMGPMDMAKTNKAIFDALKPGGLFIVLDHAATPGSGTADTETKHRIDPASVKAEVTAAGFVFEDDLDVLENSDDDHSKVVFDPSLRGHTDQFVFKFRKPK